LVLLERELQQREPNLIDRSTHAARAVSGVLLLGDFKLFGQC
jgi:hypothetical protein